jgi:hypothetical protein
MDETPKDILLRLKSVCAGLHFGTSLDSVMDAMKEIERLRESVSEWQSRYDNLQRFYETEMARLEGGR